MKIRVLAIDLDLDKNRREEAFHYLQEKYGVDNVCNIGTTSFMTTKAVIKDVARTLGYDFQKINRFTKDLPDQFDSVKEILLGHYVNNDESKMDEINKELITVLEYASQLEDMPRHQSVHAAGVVILPKPVYYYLPVRVSDGAVVSEINMHVVEESVGGVKFDLLGLRTLSVIEKTLESINYTVDIDNIPLDDPNVFDIFQSGDTVGVFQWDGSDGIRNFTRQFKPENVEDLFSINAGHRPGPKDAIDEETGLSMLDKLVKIKHGELEPRYLDKKLEPILKDTYSVILYQEQCMAIAVELAGYSLPDSDDLRRVIGKKKIEQIPKHREKFIEGSVKNGISMKVSEAIFKQIETFGKYGFNRCLDGDTEVLGFDGRFIKVKDLTQGVVLWSINERQQPTPNAVEELIDTSYQDVYRVTLANGEVIECTLDHKFLTQGGKYKTLKEMTIGDELICLVGTNSTILSPVDKVTELSKTQIVDVEYVNKRQTYNVAMKAPYHNYVLANGLISKNSHSCAYALTAYQTAYLKCYFPTEFMCATLNSVIDKPDKLEKYLNECKRMGIRLLSPNLNTSELGFTVENDHIRMGLTSIKGVGSNAAKSIKEFLSKFQITDIKDFYLYSKSSAINKTVLESLIMAGAFDFLGYSRRAMMDYLKKVLKTNSKIKSRISANSRRKKPIEDISVFYEPLYELEIEEKEEYTIDEILAREKELTGFYLSGDPLDFIPNKVLERVDEMSVTISSLPKKRLVYLVGEIESIKEITVSKGRSKGQKMCRVTLRDICGTVALTLFPEVYNKHKNIITVGNVILLRGNVDFYQEQVQIIVKECKVVKLEGSSAQCEVSL